MRQEEANFDKKDQFTLTMIPGAFTRKMRTCVLFQFIRFLVLNLKMIVVVRKSH